MSRAARPVVELAARLEEVVGVPVDADLLLQAVTHRSFSYENDDAPHNERLEFLGDSVLGVVVTETLYRTHPDLSEGRLAKLRAAVVNARALAGVGRALELGEYILLGRGEASTGGRDKDSILADTVEAVIGATYLGQGPDAATRLATAVTRLPRGRDITSVIVVGPGAQLPGIAPAFEYAAQRPVTVADNPALASALGAADAAVVAAAAPPVAPRTSTGRRWWFVGAAIGAAVFLAAVGMTLIVTAESTVAEPAPVTVTETPAAVTSTQEATVTETATETSVRTTTVTSTPRPVTRTETVTESAPETYTVTETETVTAPAGGEPSLEVP